MIDFAPLYAAAGELEEQAAAEAARILALEAEVARLTGEICPPPPPEPPARQPGLSYTPEFVPAWELATSLAEAKGEGFIPADAIDEADYPSLSAAIDAANAMDVPLAIGRDVAIDDALLRRLSRGLYGYSPNVGARPRLTFSQPQVHFWPWIHDATIRGIDFINPGILVGLAHRTLPLTNSGVVDINPYHSGSDPMWAILHVEPSGSKSAWAFPRVGWISLDGIKGTVQSITGIRQVVDSARVGAGKKLGENYVRNWDFDAQLESVELIAEPISFATRQKVADAINALTATSGCYAVADTADPNGVIICRTAGRGDFLELHVEASRTYEVKTNTRTMAIDISHCSLVNGKAALGAILDVTEMGPVRFNAVDLDGTWGGVALSVTRWSEFWAGNVHHHSCTGARAQPSGYRGNFYQTTFALGVNDLHLNWRYASNRGAIENCHIHDITSNNTIDTCNAAVGVDLRQQWARTPEDQFRVSYNIFKRMVQPGGAVDCNPIYAKPRGLDIIGNVIDGCGSPYKSASLPGSEAVVLIKEAYMEPGLREVLRVEDNVIRNCPSTHTKYAFKIDKQKNKVVRNNRHETPADATNILRLADSSGAEGVGDNPGFVLSIV